MAKRNIIQSFVRFDTAHETKLVIYENKQGYRGTLLNSYGKKIDSIMYHSKNEEQAIKFIKECFNYNDNNSY